MNISPFHLAIKVRDIEEAREFYGKKLGFEEGRSSEHWIDFNMFGHQLVTHLDPSLGKHGKLTPIDNSVDEHAVPVPHFGVVLEIQAWNELKVKVSSFITNFIIEPYIRFEGLPGEQRTMFFTDPSGNALEFKAFKNIETELFAK